MPSSCGTGSSVSPENGVSYVTFFFLLVACLRCLQIWKTTWTPVKVAYLFCRCVKVVPSYSDDFTSSISYWVIVVVPYLLYAFVTNHTQEVCEKIYKASIHCHPDAMTHLTFVVLRRSQSPWRCGTKLDQNVRLSFLPTVQIQTKENTFSRSAHSYICFLQPKRISSSGAHLCPIWRGCIPALRGRVTNDTSVKLKYVSAL